MNKNQFEKFIIKNIGAINNIHCRIWNGYDLDNQEACWLEAYVEHDGEYKTVYISDYYKPDDKKILSLQSKWSSKLKNWINPNWNIPLIVDNISI
ncbi:MAG: hypothetical protein ACLR3R_18675 [Clostridium paraputrificum]